MFLTDGFNFDVPETEEALQLLKKQLDGIATKFNVIGYGTQFNAGVLESLSKSGSHQGTI